MLSEKCLWHFGYFAGKGEKQISLEFSLDFRHLDDVILTADYTKVLSWRRERYVHCVS